MKRKISKRKILRALCLCLLPAMLIVSFIGCRKIEAVTAAEFQTAMEDLEYTVSDITKEYAQYNYIQKCVGFEDNGLHVEFFEIDTKDNAVGFYKTNKAAFENKKSGVSTETSVEIGSYCIYKLKTGDTYYVVEQVGKTAIYAYCPREGASRLDDVIKAIKY